MIYLGADHGGFELKEAIKQHLLEQGYEVEDCGTHSAESVDYAPIAQATCEKLLADKGASGFSAAAPALGFLWRQTKSTAFAPPAVPIISAQNIRAFIMTPTSFAWAAALSAQGLPVNWSTFFSAPNLKAGVISAASTKLPQLSKAKVKSPAL